MDVGSPENRLEELSGFLKEEGSFLAAESDLTFVVNKEENVEGYSYDDVARNKEFHVNLSDQGQQDSPSQHSDLRYNEISGSPSENFQSALQTGFDHDILLNGTRFADDQERLQHPSKNSHQKEEMEEVCAIDLLKSSSRVESENFHHEMETEVAAHLQECPLTAEVNQEEKMEDRPTSPSHDETGNENFLETSNYELTKSKFAYKELEHEVSDLESEKLHSSPRVRQGNNEAKRENIHSKNSPAESRKVEILHPDQHNLERIPQQSTSPRTQRKMSVSPPTSPGAYISLSNKETFASQEGLEDLSYSSRSRRQDHYFSPEKSSIGKEVLSSDHKLGSDRQNAVTPQESPHGSQHMNGSSMEHASRSPRNHNSGEKHQRRYSSASRSPVRQRDSSSRHKRDHRYRSRSRSPYRRDYYRRSPRRRYSPRRRSPPSGYHSYRRSPKRRPWSPPHNRSTGLGKPGRNLFVAGFSFLTTEKDLERKFSRFGRVRDVRIVRDKRSGDSRGFGFLSLERDEEADAAIKALDKTEWHGRIVLVEKSKSP